MGPQSGKAEEENSTGGDPGSPNTRCKQRNDERGDEKDGGRSSGRVNTGIKNGTTTKENKDKLTVFLTNADSLPNKMTELRSRIQNMGKRPDILAITEVVPKSRTYDVVSSDYFIEGYNTFTSGINEDKKRGILILVNNDLDASPLNIDSNFSEMLWIKLKLNHSDVLSLGCVYRSPNSTQENSEKLNQLMRDVGKIKSTHILVLGDFNLPKINWTTYDSNDRFSSEFIESFRDSYLYQHIKDPTRGRIGQHPNILDLVFSNEDDMVANITFDSPLGKSDHSCIMFDFVCQRDRSNCVRTFYLYNKGDYEAMKEELNATDWSAQLKTLDTPDEKYNKFLSILTAAQDKFIP